MRIESQRDYNYPAADDTWVSPHAADLGGASDKRRAPPGPHVSFAMQRAASLSAAHSAKMTKIISVETTRRLTASLRDVLLGGVGGLGASASPRQYTGSASGSINWLINLVDASPN